MKPKTKTTVLGKTNITWSFYRMCTSTNVFWKKITMNGSLKLHIIIIMYSNIFIYEGLIIFRKRCTI